MSYLAELEQRKQQQDPTVEAYAEIGVKRWPPVPSRNRSTWTADS
jgi:hypothetical protein